MFLRTQTSSFIMLCYQLDVGLFFLKYLNFSLNLELQKVVLIFTILHRCWNFKMTGRIPCSKNITKVLFFNSHIDCLLIHAYSQWQTILVGCVFLVPWGHLFGLPELQILTSGWNPGQTVYSSCYGPAAAHNHYKIWGLDFSCQ